MVEAANRFNFKSTTIRIIYSRLSPIRRALLISNPLRKNTRLYSETNGMCFIKISNPLRKLSNVVMAGTIIQPYEVSNPLQYALNQIRSDAEKERDNTLFQIHYGKQQTFKQEVHMFSRFSNPLRRESNKHMP